MWERSNAKTKSARRKRAGFEWATRSTNVEATLASVPEPAPWPPRAFAVDAATLSPDDVVEYVSDEYEVAQRPVAATLATPAREAQPRPAENARPNALACFVLENWPIAIAFVIAGGLAWRMSAAHSVAPPAPSAPIAKNATCSEAPLVSSAPPVVAASVVESATVVVPPPRPPPRPPASVKRPLPKAAPPSSTPASDATTKATAEERRALDLALTELASY